MSRKSSLQSKVSKAMRSRRVAAGISQEEFAERLGVHRTFYGLVERGGKDIRLSTLERVCKALGITITEFFRELDEQ